MPVFSPNDLARWSGGTWTFSPKTEIRSVVHDTRASLDGALYVALPGERFDGHDFLSAAVAGGAVAAVCSRGRALPSLPCLEVDNPHRALLDLAAGHRQPLGGLRVGVTGSAGKTTVKDLIASMLARRGATCKTRGNWNNHIGLPLSLLAMEPGDDFGVFELGMNHPGEIAPLAAVLRPICGLVTSIGEAHLAAFGSLEGIAREKGALLEALPPEGVAVIDVDSPWSELFLALTQARIVTCSLERPAIYTGRLCGPSRTSLCVEDAQRGRRFDIPLPLPGEHMARNLLQAVAVAREFGLTEDEIREGAERFSPAPMRWEKRKVGDWTLINDAYNANPLSMRSAIQTFAELETPVEKWLVLGGMAELGEGEVQAHRSLGEFVSRQGFHGVVCVGARAGWIAETTRADQVFHVQTPAEALDLLRAHAGPGAGILLKASREDRLERLVELMQPNPNPGNTDR